MWISKYRLERLEERLAALENKSAVAFPSFRVYEKVPSSPFLPYLSYRNLEWQDISIKDVVEKILRHLGMELAYKEGTPTTVALEKKPKAKS